MKSFLLPILLVLCAFSVFAAAPAKGGTLPLAFDTYYTYDEMALALHTLQRTYPQLSKLEVAGKSEEGRTIWWMTIHNPKTGEEAGKPGIYVDGNIHGNEIQAGEVCLYLLNQLLTQYGKNAEITKLVDTKVFYVVPVVNVDGRYHFFADPNYASSGRTICIAKDDDHDGLIDEDGPDDLDGDGNLCQMRKRDPSGRLKTDPDDSRLMIPVKPGERGEWILLGTEGIDNDGDGRVNEDGVGYVDGNRNWSFDWQPPYVQDGAGDYPLEAVGLKDLASFITQHPNICMGWAFHNSGGMYLRGPSSESLADYSPEDIAVLDFIGHQGERITPGYHYTVCWRDLYSTHGDFSEWLTRCRGAYAFVGELFQQESETFRTTKEMKQANQGKQENDEEGVWAQLFGDRTPLDRERLKFNDNLAQGELYKPWKPFKHPLYGDIEIGGWVKMSSRLPHPFMLGDLVHRNAAAVLFSAKQTPDVFLEVVETRTAGKGLTRVRVRLTNRSIMPSMSRYARDVRLYPQDTLTLTGMKVVAGGLVINPFSDEVQYVEYRPHLQFLTVPGNGKVEIDFLLSGSGTATLEYNSCHAGKLRQAISVK